MGTVADKLDLLMNTKDAIRQAIIGKGQAIADEDPFSSYPEKITAIQTAGKPGTPLDPVQVYTSTRPADWLPMPEPQDNEMYLLFHIPDGVSSLLAFTVTCDGNYTVALGTVIDGAFVQQSAQTVASGEKYEAELFADDFGSLTADGMKQCMVKVSGTNIKTWEPSVHSKKSAPTYFSGWNIVEISCNIPSGETVKCGNVTTDRALKKLKYFSWVGGNNVTSTNSMFYGCYSLVAILQLDTSNVLDMRSMFHICQSLTAIPQLDTSNVLDTTFMFYNCYSLTAIPQLNTSSVTSMTQMFDNCYSLLAIPQFDTSNVTSMSGLFSGCYSLTTIPQLDTSSVTEMSTMFYSCYSLTAIPQLDTSNVTNMNSMFNSCYSLTAIPQLDTSNVTTMNNMFQNCYSLTAIPQLDTSNVTNMYNPFYNCTALATVLFNPSVTGWAGYKISLSNCSLGHAALVDLFNSLPTITSAKALTLTGNPGVAELTDAEKAIATGKNWTLTL